jgi:hypothetical protein
MESKKKLYRMLKSNKDDSKSICYLLSISPATRRSVYRNFVQPNKSFSTSTTVSKFYSSVITIIEINLDDQIAKIHFSTPLTYLNLSQEHRWLNNTILYRMKDLKGATWSYLIKIDLVNNIYWPSTKRSLRLRFLVKVLLIHQIINMKILWIWIIEHEFWNITFHQIRKYYY